MANSTDNAAPDTLVNELREQYAVQFKEEQPSEVIYRYERERFKAADALEASAAREADLQRDIERHIEIATDLATKEAKLRGALTELDQTLSDMLKREVTNIKRVPSENRQGWIEALGHVLGIMRMTTRRAGGSDG